MAGKWRVKVKSKSGNDLAARPVAPRRGLEGGGWCDAAVRADGLKNAHSSGLVWRRLEGLCSVRPAAQRLPRRTFEAKADATPIAAGHGAERGGVACASDGARRGLSWKRVAGVDKPTAPMRL